MKKSDTELHGLIDAVFDQIKQDVEKFAEENQTLNMGDTPLTNLVAEAVELYWGERCSEHEDGCPVCEAWQQYDNLTGERA